MQIVKEEERPAGAADILDVGVKRTGKGLRWSFKSPTFHAHFKELSEAGGFPADTPEVLATKGHFIRSWKIPIFPLRGDQILRNPDYNLHYLEPILELGEGAGGVNLTFLRGITIDKGLSFVTSEMYDIGQVHTILLGIQKGAEAYYLTHIAPLEFSVSLRAVWGKEAPTPERDLNR